MRKKDKALILISSLGLSTLALTFALNPNNVFTNVIGINRNVNAVKTFTLDLSAEHTFDGTGKAREYALNENANNYGVAFDLTRVSSAVDAMTVVNNKTRLRLGDTIENVTALSGVTKIVVNGGNGYYHLFGGYTADAMYEFLESESNSGTNTFDNIPSFNYFKLVGKFDNYITDIASIEFTYTADEHTCSYGSATAFSDVTVQNGTYNKYSVNSVDHTAVVADETITLDTDEYTFAGVVYDGKLLYTAGASDNLLVSFDTVNHMAVIDCVDRYSDRNGSYVLPVAATAIEMRVDGAVVNENTAAFRYEVTVGDSFTFAATSDAMPAQDVAITLNDESAGEADPFVGTYTPKNELSAYDMSGVWNGGSNFDIEIDPIVVTKVGNAYSVEYSDHANGDYPGFSGTFAGTVSGNTISFTNETGYLSIELDLSSNSINYSYLDDSDEYVMIYASVNFNFEGSAKPTATLSGGVVTASAVGDFNLVCTTGSITSTYYVHVGAYTPATVSVANNNVALTEGQTSQINATVNVDATNKALTYSSNKTSVATVSNTGLITAVKAGNAVITVRTADGNTATVNVTVSAGNKSYTFEDDNGALITINVVPNVSITINNEVEDFVFNYDSSDELYHYENDADVTVSIRESGRAYLDYVDDNQVVFNYEDIVDYGQYGYFELN